MNKLTKISAAVALLGCTALTGAMAQTTYNPSAYVMPSINIVDPDSRFGVGNAPGVGLRFGKPIAQSWDLQIGASYAQTTDSGRRYTLPSVGIDALYMFSRAQLRPFLLVGIGGQRDRIATAAGRVASSAPFINIGGGVQYSLSDQWFLQADLRRVHAYQPDANLGFRGTNNNVLSLGVAYVLEKPVTRVATYVAPPAPAPYVAPPMAAAPAPAPYVAPYVAPPPPAPAPAPAAPPPPPQPRFERITLSATELFEFDRSDLRAAQPKLDEIARVLNGGPLAQNLVITGYTDRLGSDAYNQKLSERRAESVKSYLVAKGVNGARLTTQGKGEANPVVNCDNKNRGALIQCLEPNRRVEVEQITIERRIN